MTRREFMVAAAGAVLVFGTGVRDEAAVADEPMGLLGLIDDDTYRSWVYAKATITGVTLAALGRESAAALRRWRDFEQAALEGEASEQYGRPVRFEVIDEDGQWLRREPDRDEAFVLFRERMA